MPRKVRVTPEAPEAELLALLAEILDAAAAALAVVDADDARPPGARAAAFCGVAEQLEEAVWLAAEAAASAHREIVQRLVQEGWIHCSGCLLLLPEAELVRHVYRGGDGQPAKNVPEQAWYSCSACEENRT